MDLHDTEDMAVDVTEDLQFPEDGIDVSINYGFQKVKLIKLQLKVSEKNNNEYIQAVVANETGDTFVQTYFLNNKAQLIELGKALGVYDEVSNRVNLADVKTGLQNREEYWFMAETIPGESDYPPKFVKPTALLEV